MAEVDRPEAHIDERIERLVVPGVDVGPVADAMARRRDRILAGWLAAAAAQPFHHDKPDAAVADHIPELVDAVVGVLRRSAQAEEVVAPMDDEAVSRAATAHARARFEQGLGPVAVLTEFRLLRQEISRALAAMLDDADAQGIITGQAIVDDALDGAATVGLSSLSERVEAIREELLATTLHDLRQPVTVLTGSLDLAARRLGKPETDQAALAELLEGAITAAGEVSVMLDTLGDASRVAMGALDPALEPASLEEVVAASLALLDRDARERVVPGPPPESRLIGLWDPGLLRRVVVNLVGNALKYSPPGEPVTVTMARADDAMASLEVRDQGMGLTPDERDRIFRRFSRAERARAQGIPGLGLGLYAARGIVQAHAGTIEVHSDGPGHGTSVVVRLPLLDGEADLAD